jgi:hypothetical protein
VCRSSQRVSEVADADESNCDEYNTYYMDTIHSQAHGEPPWRVPLYLCNQELVFKIDTGADVSVLSRATYNGLKTKPLLQKSHATLRGPGGNISYDGEFTAIVRYKERQCECRMFVVPTQTDYLLSREAASRLGLIHRLDAVEDPLYGDLTVVHKCKPAYCSKSEKINLRGF